MCSNLFSYSGQAESDDKIFDFRQPHHVLVFPGPKPGLTGFICRRHNLEWYRISLLDIGCGGYQWCFFGNTHDSYRELRRKFNRLCRVTAMAEGWADDFDIHAYNRSLVMHPQHAQEIARNPNCVYLKTESSVNGDYSDEEVDAIFYHYAI